MAYDEILAVRLRAVMRKQEGLEEKKMFGGVGFLINGNLACGVNKNDLIVRVGPEKSGQALRQNHTHIFDMTGRPMVGWIVVEPAGFGSDEDLLGWIQQGIDFALTLPKKDKN